LTALISHAECSLTHLRLALRNEHVNGQSHVCVLLSVIQTNISAAHRDQ